MTYEIKTFDESSKKKHASCFKKYFFLPHVSRNINLSVGGGQLAENNVVSTS